MFELLAIFRLHLTLIDLDLRKFRLRRLVRSRTQFPVQFQHRVPGISFDTTFTGEKKQEKMILIDRNGENEM